jgi:hypothetical protein
VGRANREVAIVHSYASPAIAAGRKLSLLQPLSPAHGDAGAEWLGPPNVPEYY